MGGMLTKMFRQNADIQVGYQNMYNCANEYIGVRVCGKEVIVYLSSKAWQVFLFCSINQSAVAPAVL